MNDNELMSFIRAAAKTANDHRYSHGPDCPPVENATYAMGQPPKGWKARAAKYAQKIGWRIGYSWVPRMNGDTCDGGTTGKVAPPGMQRMCMIAPDLSPAREYAVTAHELAHATLHHPADTEHEAFTEQLSRIFKGQTENFSHETAAHLAAIGASKAAGLRIGQPSVCYLTRRVLAHGRKIGEDEILAAFQAARMIRDGLA